VEEIMTTNPLTVSVDTQATKVRSFFREDGYRSIPVVYNDHLEGIITRGDMMNISSTKSNIEARGIMEHPKIIATPEMPMMELARKLLKADTVQAPVVMSNDNMQVVGIVSIIDILRKLFYNGTQPKDENIGEITTKKVVSCNYDDLISKVWDLMDETGFSGLPVNKKKKLIGMITRKDIINSGHVRIGKESDETRRSIKVEKIMKTPPLVATPQSTIHDVAQIMLENDIGRLPVVEHPVHIKKEPSRITKADLVGIVAREDILSSYLK
jgi:CBS domain-containing protein